MSYQGFQRWSCHQGQMIWRMTFVSCTYLLHLLSSTFLQLSMVALSATAS